MSSAKDSGLHVLHDDALAGGNFQLVGHLGSDRSYRDAEAAFFRRAVFTAFLVVAETGGKQLGAVADGDRRFLLLAVADETEVDFGAGLAAGDIGYQFIAVLHRFAVDGNNGVSAFEAGLIGWAAGRDIGIGTRQRHAIDT